MFVSVILSTCNSADLLEKVLWGYAAQTHRPFEVVIADDGSTDHTLDVLDAMERESGLDLRHVWQPHEGFRKCVILNRAIEVARADYVVISDGDCVPRHDFLARHVEFARTGHFLSGGCIRLDAATSRSLNVEAILSREGFQLGWLQQRLSLPWHRRLRLGSHPLLARWLDRLTPTRATWNGHNSSGWRNELLMVNGFDERMQYGGLDREMGERLVNAGVRPLQIRHRAVCLHLDHPRNYVTAESWARNGEIRRQTRNQRLTWTPYGIAQTPLPRMVPAGKRLKTATRTNDQFAVKAA